MLDRTFVIGDSFSPTQLSLVDVDGRVELHASGMMVAYFDEETGRLTLPYFSEEIRNLLSGLAFSRDGDDVRLAVQTEHGMILKDTKIEFG